MIGINKFVAHGWHVCQYAKPTERVDAFEFLDRALWYRLATDAMISVAADNEITVDPVSYAIHFIRDIRVFPLEMMRGHIVCAVF